MNSHDTRILFYQLSRDFPGLFASVSDARFCEHFHSTFSLHWDLTIGWIDYYHSVMIHGTWMEHTFSLR